jgi:hypothetical protein
MDQAKNSNALCLTLALFPLTSTKSPTASWKPVGIRPIKKGPEMRAFLFNIDDFLEWTKFQAKEKESGVRLNEKVNSEMS